MHFSRAFWLGTLALSACAESRAAQQPSGSAHESMQASAPAESEQEGAESGMHARGGMRHGDMGGMCPMAVGGAEVRSEDVQGGAALVFTTTEDVAELRERVAHMAKMHEQHAGEGSGMMMGGDMHPEHEHHGGNAMHGGKAKQANMPQVNVRSEPVEGGARLVITPKDPADVERVRAQVREHAGHMASGQCPMMSKQGAAPGPASGVHEHHHSEGAE